MRTIEATATVADDGTLTVRVPSDLPPGKHKVVLVVEDYGPSRIEQSQLDLPEFDVGPWPDGLSLRREDMYDDWGR